MGVSCLFPRISPGLNAAYLTPLNAVTLQDGIDTESNAYEFVATDSAAFANIQELKLIWTVS